MKRLYQVVFAITVMVAQVLPAPSAMTCLLRFTQGFGAHACCRQMARMCGAGSKTSSAGCCARKTDDADPKAISPRPLDLDHELASFGPPIPFAGGVNLRRAGGVAEWLQTHPPGPDLSESTHLRI
jgi:hypothetical protein